MRDRLLRRFEHWVRQFQGHRTGINDYQKTVIGLPRMLRTFAIEYESLRKSDFLTDDEVRRLDAYFVFAARRLYRRGRLAALQVHTPPADTRSPRADCTIIPASTFRTGCTGPTTCPTFNPTSSARWSRSHACSPSTPTPAWLRKGLDDIEAQLNAYCGKSGAWEESIVYALFTFAYFIITFRTLKNRMGIDYFQHARACGHSPDG